MDGLADHFQSVLRLLLRLEQAYDYKVRLPTISVPIWLLIFSMREDVLICHWFAKCCMMQPCPTTLSQSSGRPNTSFFTYNTTSPGHIHLPCTTSKVLPCRIH